VRQGRRARRCWAVLRFQRRRRPSKTYWAGWTRTQTGKPYGVRPSSCPPKVPTEGTFGGHRQADPTVPIGDFVPPRHSPISACLPLARDDEEKSEGVTGLAAFGRPLTRRGGAKATRFKADRQRAGLPRPKGTSSGTRAHAARLCRWARAGGVAPKHAQRHVRQTASTSSIGPRGTRRVVTPGRRSASMVLVARRSVNAIGGSGRGGSRAGGIGSGRAGRRSARTRAHRGVV